MPEKNKMGSLPAMSRGARVLVTGGAGFIGSHTVDLLLERGYRVRILDNLQPRVHPRGKPEWVSREAEFVQGDVTSARDLAQGLESIEAVFHLAAFQDYLPEFSRFLHTNAESAALLFELIVADRKRFPVRKIVFASSQSVCGEGRYVCSGGADVDNTPYGQERIRTSAPTGKRGATGAAHGVMSPPLRSIEQLRQGRWEILCPTCGKEMEPLRIDEGTANPHTAYGVSKYAIEQLARCLGQRYGIPTACMRYTYVQRASKFVFQCVFRRGAAVCHAHSLRQASGGLRRWPAIARLRERARRGARQRPGHGKQRGGFWHI